MIALVLFTLGFLFISALSLALDLSAISVSEKYAGTANSSLWLLSQVGSVVLIVLFESMERATGWNSTLILSAGFLMLSALLTALLREWCISYFRKTSHIQLQNSLGDKKACKDHAAAGIRTRATGSGSPCPTARLRPLLFCYLLSICK